MEEDQQDKQSTKTMPFLVAFLLCDSAIKEEGTNKHTLVGIFDRVYAYQFPAKQKMAIYIRLGFAKGHYQFRIDYIQVKKDKRLMQINFEADFPELVPEGDFMLKLPGDGIPIPESGQYEFRLWTNEHYIGRAGFTAEKIPDKGGLS